MLAEAMRLTETRQIPESKNGELERVAFGGHWFYQIRQEAVRILRRKGLPAVRDRAPAGAGEDRAECGDAGGQ
jgi:hypothetical protein